MCQLDFFIENGIVTDFTYNTNGNIIRKEVQIQGGDIWDYVSTFDKCLIEVKEMV